MVHIDRREELAQGLLSETYAKLSPVQRSVVDSSRPRPRRG